MESRRPPQKRNVIKPKHKQQKVCQFYWYWAKSWCGSDWESFTTHTVSSNDEVTQNIYFRVCNKSRSSAFCFPRLIRVQPASPIAGRLNSSTSSCFIPSRCILGTLPHAPPPLPTLPLLPVHNSSAQLWTPPKFDSSGRSHSNSGY